MENIEKCGNYISGDAAPKREVAREILSNLKREIHDKAVYPGVTILPYVQLRAFDAVINDFIKRYCDETRSKE